MKKKRIRGLFSHRTKVFIRACLYLPISCQELIANYFYDLFRFVRYSSVLRFCNTQQQLRSWIDADSHKLEKGLSLRNPRPGFGLGVAERLIRNANEYVKCYENDQSIQCSISVLREYRSFNQLHNIDYSPLFSHISQLESIRQKPYVAGGYNIVSKVEWQHSAKMDLLPFFRSRHSVRDFSDEKVNYDLIVKAVEMAMYTPTVCNRQAAKVYAFTEDAQRKKVISCQMGNAGFGDHISVAMIITVDRQCFFTTGERNQCWIDGGLFSMSLIYALHSLGLGACCLNWSVTKERDQQLRSVAPIQESEAVIMMIGVGHLNDEFKVATSSRKSLDDFLVNGNPIA